MSIAGPAGREPEELPGHFQMEQESPVPRLDDQDLPSPAHGRDPGAPKPGEVPRKGGLQELRKGAIHQGDPQSDDPRPQADGHGFDLGKLGHEGGGLFRRPAAGVPSRRRSLR